MLLDSFLAWIPMVVIAIANGVLREMTYGRRLSELRAHQLSSFTAMVALGAYIWARTRYWEFESGGQALAVGLLWLLLTVAFEFLFGHFVAGHSWRRLLRDYDLRAGRLWAPVLAWIALAPWVFWSLRA